MAVREIGSVKVVGLIRDVLGLDLDLRSVQPLGRGQGRTYLCRMGEQDVVVKWGLDPDLVGKIPYVAEQVSGLRHRDCLVPAIIAHGPLPGRGYGWVQQHLPGTPATALDATLLSDLVELIDRFGDAPAGVHRSDFAQWAPSVVLGDAAGW
jgi:hypothetical protein